MSKSYYGKTKVCNYVCAVLTLCLVILQFTPFWYYAGTSTSINGYVWLRPNDAEIGNWFSSQLGSAPNTDSIVISSVLILLCGVFGLVLCIVKSEIGLVALLPAAAGLSGIYAFAFQPVFRLGSTWIIQLILCIAVLFAAILAIVYWRKSTRQTVTEKTVLSQSDIDARVAAIRALGSTNGNKKSKGADSDANFNTLLTYLSDEVPECRIAAAETLGKTARDSAFTHISYLLKSETDARVIKAMRGALISIRENMRIAHAEKA